MPKIAVGTCKYTIGDVVHPASIIFQRCAISLDCLLDRVSHLSGLQEQADTT